MSDKEKPILDYKPEPMRIGILTAAIQELTPRGIRDQDPDRAIEDWVEFASTKLGLKNIQLSAALHPTLTDVPPEAMLDPVANTLDLREPFNSQRAERVLGALKRNGVRISEVAYFDNMLTRDRAARELKYQFWDKASDAALMLGVDSMVGFVGRDPFLDMDQNVQLFRELYIPLLKRAKEKGLRRSRIEQCPMPGWNTTDIWENNIAYTPEMWIKLHQEAEKEGVGDLFRITFDPSHAILMGQNTRDVFQYLKDSGYGFLIDAFHVKGQVIDPKAIAAWGYRGQTAFRGDRKDGQPDPDPRNLGNAWKKMGYCMHELPGTARHDPLAYLQNRTVDWLDHQLAAREVLGLGGDTDLVVEHEFPPARHQNVDKLVPILRGSCDYVRAIDEAAASMYALHNVLRDQGIQPQGVGRTAYRD